MPKGTELALAIAIGAKINSSFQKAMGTVDKETSKIGSAAKKAGIISAAALAGIGTAAAASAKALYNLGAEFDKGVDTIRIGTGATGKQLDGLKSSMENVFSSVPTDVETASQAIADYNTRLGVSGETLETLSGQAIQVSDMLGEDLTSTIESSSQAFQQWNIGEDEMSEKMDYLFKVSQSTGMGFNELSGNMQKYGAQLQEMGYSFDSAAALVGQLEKAGVNTNEVLGAMKKSVGVLAKDGISASEGMEQYCEQIKNAGSAAEATAIASEVFGSKAGSTMASAIRNGTLSVADLTKELENSDEGISKAAEDTYSFAERMQMAKNKMKVALEPMANTIFDSLEEIMPVIEDLITELSPVLGDLAVMVGDMIGDILPEIMPVIKDIVPVLSEVFSELAKNIVPVLGQFITAIMPTLSKLISTLLPVISQLIQAILPPLSQLLMALLPPLMQIIQAILPVVTNLISMLAPIISNLITAITPLFDVITALAAPLENLITKMMPILEMVGNFVSKILEALMPAIESLAGILTDVLGTAFEALSPIIDVIVELLSTIMDAILPVITPMIEALKPIFDALSPVLKVIGDVIGIIVGALSKVVGWISSGLSWLVKLFFGSDSQEKGKKNAKNAKTYATGGFTDGVSIAGEDPRYPTEAIISFNPAYRDSNIGYWQQAGRMLGVYSGEGGKEETVPQIDELNKSLSRVASSSNASQSTNYNGNNSPIEIVYSPNIVIEGNADKQQMQNVMNGEFEKFKKFMNQYLKENQRLNFAK